MEFPAIVESSCVACKKAIFGFSMAISCPECGMKQEEATATILTFHESGVLSSPKPLTLCFRPTHGSFANYNTEMLLHIGISDSLARVFHFDERGIHLVDNSFGSCICSIPLISKTDSSAQFDSLLFQHSQNWRERYHPISSNCYSFVISFMNKINAFGRKDHVKNTVVLSYIQPPLLQFEAYHSVFKKLLSKDFVITEFNVNQNHKYSCNVCSKLITTSTRWHCKQCIDYDLCDDCHDKRTDSQSLCVDGHLISHILERL